MAMANRGPFGLAALTVALLAGCAADRQQQPQPGAAIEQARERRDACYADAALALDDGVSDASSIGRAVAARCRTYSEELARIAPSRTASGTVPAAGKHADDVATAYVLEFRRLRRMPG